MSTQGHPLDDALTDAERAGAGYEVPVELVRAGVRRRRRVRAVARGAAAVAAVAAVAVAAPTVLGGWDGGAPAAQGDWPAQFDRCGKPVEIPAEGDAGPLSVTVEPSFSTIRADRLALVTIRVGAEAGPVTDVGHGGSQISLVQDDVVVAVEDAAAPVVVELPTTPWRSRAPVYATWDFGAVLASCAQYPDGDGDPQVPAGSYEMVVTQTVEWSTALGREGSTTVTRTFPMAVTEDEPSPEEDRAACLADASVLHTLTEPEANPIPVAVDADVPGRWAAGEGLAFTVTTTNVGTTDLSAQVEPPTVLLVRDGEVVGTPLVWRDADVAGSAMSPGASIAHEVTAPLLDCTTTGLDDAPGAEEGRPLQPGQYEVWVVLDLRVAGPAGFDGTLTPERVVGGPWPLTLE